MNEILDIIIQLPSSTYRLEWRDNGVRMLWNDRIIAHGFAGQKITEEILRESVEKVFAEIRTMINNVLPKE